MKVGLRGADEPFVLLRRVNLDDLDDLNAQNEPDARIRRFRGMRLAGLLVIGAILAFALWNSNLFEKWAGKNGLTDPTATTFYVTDGATIADKAVVGEDTWFLVVQPTSDQRLCYQLADAKARVIFSCTGPGIAPMAPGSADAAAIVIPPLSVEAPMPPVILGATSRAVERVELRSGNAVQRIAPVAWPELGRNGFIVAIDPALAKEFLKGSFVAVAFDSTGKCIGATRGIPTGALKLDSTRDCPKN